MTADRKGPVLCELCRRNPARIHIEKLEKGRDKRVFRFCENCAAKCGIVIPDRFLSSSQKPTPEDPITKMGYAEEDDILNMLSQQLEIPLVDLAQLEVDRKVVALLPKELAKRYRCLCIRIERKDVVVVFADPFDVRAIDEVKDFLGSRGYEVRPAIAREKDIENAVDEYYGLE